MFVILQPWHILQACVCGLVNQRQQQIIEFQNAQIEALLKQLGKKRMLARQEMAVDARWVNVGDDPLPFREKMERARFRWCRRDSPPMPIPVANVVRREIPTQQIGASPLLLESGATLLQLVFELPRAVAKPVSPAFLSVTKACSGLPGSFIAASIAALHGDGAGDFLSLASGGEARQDLSD